MTGQGAQHGTTACAAPAVVGVVRQVGPADVPDLISLMQPRARAAMFPLATLHDGLLRGPGETLEARRAAHGWLIGQGRGDGQGAAFLCLSGAGYLSAFHPGDWTAAELAALQPHLAGRRLVGLVAADGQALPLLDGLGLGAAPRRHQDEEPGFALALADLRLPPVEGFHLALPQDHLEQVMRWRLAYLAELFALTGPAAETRAAAEVAGWIAADSHRVLIGAEGLPLALSGFNARIPGVVQIGGVFTPPQARGRGLARRMVGLHLAEARREGVTRAVLFAANDAAASAYRALGFVRDGSMGVVEFDGEVEVPPWP